MIESSVVKGVVLRGILRDIKENFPGGIPKFFKTIPQEIYEKYYTNEILHPIWYPYEMFTTTLDTYLHVVGNDVMETIERLGAGSALRDLNTSLRLYALFTSPHKVGQHAPTVWIHRFKSCGSISLTDKQERSFKLVLTGFKEIHPLHCSFLLGYGLGIGRVWNKNVTVSHDRCVHKGDEVCSWLSAW